MRIVSLCAGMLAAALLAGNASAQTTKERYCLKGDAGVKACVYRTLSQCEQARLGEGGYCSPNPNR
jgi:Protein of unknown function (DUF3551)